MLSLSHCHCRCRGGPLSRTPMLNSHTPCLGNWPTCLPHDPIWRPSVQLVLHLVASIGTDECMRSSCDQHGSVKPACSRDQGRAASTLISALVRPRSPCCHHCRCGRATPPPICIVSPTFQVKPTVVCGSPECGGHAAGAGSPVLPRGVRGDSPVLPRSDSPVLTRGVRSPDSPVLSLVGRSDSPLLDRSDRENSPVAGADPSTSYLDVIPEARGEFTPPWI